MTRRQRLVMQSGIAAALAGCAIAAGCGSELPTTPTAAFGQGVTLYRDSLYRGEGITLGGDVADLSKVRGPCGGESESGAPSNFDDCDVAADSGGLDGGRVPRSRVLRELGDLYGRRAGPRRRVRPVQTRIQRLHFLAPPLEAVKLRFEPDRAGLCKPVVTESSSLLRQ